MSRCQREVSFKSLCRSIYYIMSDLADKKCIPSRRRYPPFDKSEIHKFLKKVDGWDVKSDQDKVLSNRNIPLKIL